MAILNKLVNLYLPLPWYIKTYLSIQVLNCIHHDLQDGVTESRSPTMDINQGSLDKYGKIVESLFIVLQIFLRLSLELHLIPTAGFYFC